MAPVAASLEIARQVCLGLHYAHSLQSATGQPLGIVHRDISPSNLMLSFHGAREDPRLRHRPRRRGAARDAHAGRHDEGQGFVHVPGADPDGARRQPLRHLRGRHRAARVADRPPAVQGHQRISAARGWSSRRRPAPLVGEPGGAARRRSRRDARARARRRGALPDRRRDGGGSGEGCCSRCGRRRTSRASCSSRCSRRDRRARGEVKLPFTPSAGGASDQCCPERHRRARRRRQSPSARRRGTGPPNRVAAASSRSDPHRRLAARPPAAQSVGASGARWARWRHRRRGRRPRPPALGGTPPTEPTVALPAPPCARQPVPEPPSARRPPPAKAVVEISLDSSPQDAQVIREDSGEVVGRTPLTIKLPQGTRRDLVPVREGRPRADQRTRSSPTSTSRCAPS